MTLQLGGWIHSFAVTDTLTHKKGYTIYKITSVVFPRSIPEALTCITVWKRFHDVKRLHREIVRRHKKLNMSGSIPEPSDCSFFKRFEPSVLQKRKEYILELLDFIALHPALYKSHSFIQFFENGQSIENSPLHTIVNTDKGNIEKICDSLDLQYEDNVNLIDPKRDTNDVESDANDQAQQATHEEEEKNGQILSSFDNVAKPKINKNSASFLTPMASIENEDSDYIYEAALEFSKAVQAEVDCDYREAYNRYKRGVEVLLSGTKDDCNDERKTIAKTKISKYMTRAEDIYERFLLDSEEMKNWNFQLSVDVSDGSLNSVDGTELRTPIYLERPWNNLAKFKVLQILDRVMLVQSVTERNVYVMKGIEKPSNISPAQSVFLPQRIPYMVDLIAFFQSDQKVFLLLRQAKGGKLFEYVNSYMSTVQPVVKSSVNQIFTEVDPDVSVSSNHCVPDSEYAECTNNIPSENSEFSEIVRYSQELLKSVSNTLAKVKDKSECKTEYNCASLTTTKRISNQQCIILHESSVKKWAQELIIAIHSLHLKGVILGDLHSDNLLLGAKGQLLLSYFYQNERFTDNGFAQKSHSHRALAGHFVAPERPLTIKSDWWSFGVLMYHLLVGFPYKLYHPGYIELYSCVQYPNANLSANARNLLDGLLQHQPENRFDHDQIRSHAFFAGTNWDEVLKNSLNCN